MIRYNMRYRGAFEYDKFALNILQYSNLINHLYSDIENEESYLTLKEVIKELDLLFINSEKTSENVYKKYIMTRK